MKALKRQIGVVNHIRKGDFISACGTGGLPLENYVQPQCSPFQKDIQILRDMKKKQKQLKKMSYNM